LLIAKHEVYEENIRRRREEEAKTEQWFQPDKSFGTILETFSESVALEQESRIVPSPDGRGFAG